MSRIELKPKGGLLIAGGGAASPYVDDATLRDNEGVPFVPATALKGAIREQAERLLGRDAARSLFGGEGPEEGQGEPGRVRIGPAVVEDPAVRERFRAGFGYEVRTSVSIDRRTRRAAERRLFTREIVAPFIDDLVFFADLDDSALAQDERRMLHMAIEAVFALGHSRTSGMGGVQLRVVRQPAGPAAAAVELPREERFLLELEAASELCLGGSLSPGNDYATEPFIPAATLRGALVGAALRTRCITGDQTGTESFRELLLDPEQCLRIGDALPAADERLPRFAPFTLRTCKLHGAEHGHGDGLVRGALQVLLAGHGIFVQADQRCPVCRGRTEAAPPLLDTAPAVRRVHTSVAIDRTSGRAADGKLFSLQVLEQGTRFLALLDNVSDAGRALVADASCQELTVGKGRGRGLGAVRVRGARLVDVAPLPDRLRRLDSTVRSLLDEAAALYHTDDLRLPASSSVVAVTLLGDLVPAAPAGRLAEEALLAELGLEGARILFGQVRSGRKGGFDTLRGRLKPLTPVIRAGSVLLLHLPAPAGELPLATLARLERHGAGARRDEGFGWLRFSDDIHQPGWSKP